MTVASSPDIATIDVAKLAAKDQPEVERLLQAAQYPGFFYLDFNNHPDTKGPVGYLSEIYKLTGSYFDQPIEGKMKDIRNGQPASSDRGYKFCESDESFEMSYHELEQGKLQLPSALSGQAAMLNGFHTGCHLAAKTMLSRLSEALSLPLEVYHRPGEPSETGLKLIAEPTVKMVSDVLENKHRDSGTFTILFYDKWGLQIYLPSDDTWVFIPPPAPGCALSHVANTLQQLTENRLHSPLHRVTQLSDGAAKRYFISYFLRPKNASEI